MADGSLKVARRDGVGRQVFGREGWEEVGRVRRICHCKETYANQPIARRTRASRVYFAIWTALVSETQAEFSETTPKYLRQKPKRAAAARPATIVVTIH